MGTGFLGVIHFKRQQAKGVLSLRRQHASELFSLQNRLSDTLSIGRVDLAERQLTDMTLDPQVTALAVIDAQGTVVLANRPEWKGQHAATALPGYAMDEAQRSRDRQTSHVVMKEPFQLFGYAALDAAISSEELRPQSSNTLFILWDLSDRMTALKQDVVEEALTGWLVNVCIAIGLAALIHRLMIHRLRNLHHMMSQVGEGHLDVQWALKGDDEIDELGQAFDAMTRQLRSQQEALLDSEARLRKLLMQSPAPVAVFKRDGTLDLLSQSFSSSFGYAVEDAPSLDQMWARMLPDSEYSLEVREQWHQWMHQHSFGEGLIPRREYGILCKDRSQRIVDVQASLLGTYLVMTFHDLTDRVEAEHERARLESEVQHAKNLESLGTLAGGISHDMNNVLGAILGMASMLKIKHTHDRALAHALDTIEMAAQRGADLVKGLTAFARKGLETRRSFDLNEVVRQEGELLSHTTLQKIRVDMELEPGLPLISGDPSAIGSCIMNLCVNAVQAMPEGGVLGLRTRLHASHHVELTVSDTGTGIPPELLKRIFDPFFTTKPVGQGTGLGLALVASTLRAHGGSVDVDSAPGKGTCFTLRFPMSRDFATPEAPREPASSPGKGPLQVLVVDDDALVRQSIVATLSALGHDPIQASSVHQAMDQLRHNPLIDVLIMDHNMPDLTGGEGLRSIKAQWPKLPVIMASGHMDDQLHQILSQFPEVLLLPKPFALEALAQELDHVMGQKTRSS